MIKKKQILVADDNRNICRVIATIAERNGVGVRIVHDGGELLERNTETIAGRPFETDLIPA